MADGEVGIGRVGIGRGGSGEWLEAGESGMEDAIDNVKSMNASTTMTTQQLTNLLREKFPTWSETALTIAADSPLVRLSLGV